MVEKYDLPKLKNPNLGENLSKPFKHNRFMQLVTIKLQSFNELLDGPFRFEGEERKAVGDISPLPGLFCKSESLAELLDDALHLTFLLATVSNTKTGMEQRRSHFFNVLEQRLDRVLERLLINLMLSRRQVTDD